MSTDTDDGRTTLQELRMRLAPRAMHIRPVHERVACLLESNAPSLHCKRIDHAGDPGSLPLHPGTLPPLKGVLEMGAPQGQQRPIWTDSL